MRRRDFILGGTALAAPALWQRAATAQQAGRMRRLGVLLPWDANDPVARSWFGAFTQGLAELGWTVDRNLRIDVRWEGDSADRTRTLAKEVVDLQPDVIFSSNTPQTTALWRETRTIPIIFVLVSDPVGSGLVASVARPGGNITGFMLQEASMVSKWLELLTEIAPGVNRVAMMFNPETAPYVESYYQPIFEAAARSLKVAPIVAPVRSDAEIEAAITSIGREPGGGLINMPDRFMQLRVATILTLTARYNVPAVNNAKWMVTEGSLLSYGPDFANEYHRAADYVDRVLRGANPADLPVQLPTKFELAINLKTAKALGLTVPELILQRADEVIE